MSDKIYVTPAKGLKVRNPDVPAKSPEAHLPDDGAEVKSSSYWKRREKDGDVKISKKAPAKSVATKGDKS